MSDPRSVYASRYVDRVCLRPRAYWDAELARPTAEQARPATVVEAWWEMLGLPLLARRDERGAA